MLRNRMRVCILSFFAPEHGRYVSSFLLNFLVEQVPVFLRRHYYDCFNMVPFVCSVIIIIIALLAKSFSLFSKKSLFVFSCAYFFFFLFFFNTHIHWCEYMNAREIDIFIFCTFPIIFYFWLYFLLIKHFLKMKIPNKRDFWLISILTFLVGISAETQNLFFLCFWVLLIFGQILSILVCKKSQEQEKNKKFLNFMLILGSIYVLSLVVYYSNPIDHSMSFSNDNENLFAEFADTFGNFVLKPYWLLPMISVLTSLMILLTRKFHTLSDNRMVIFSLVNLFSLFLFYFFGNLLIEFFWMSAERYSLCVGKFLLVFLLILFINVSVALGYLADTRLTAKKAKIVKILVLVIALIFTKNLRLGEYIPVMAERRRADLYLRNFEYKLYKILYEQKHQEKVILPLIEFDENLKDYYNTNHRLRHLFFGAVHLSDDFDETTVLFYSPKVQIPELTEKEKSLRFTDFIVPVRQRGKDRFYDGDIKEEFGE